MIKTAVIPVAGMGTRTLPFTKSVAKELLPIGFKPVIQHIIEECSAVGINHVILVTSPIKQNVADHFSHAPYLSESLREKGKEDLAQMVDTICPSTMKIETVIQSKPLGLGHAILCAEQSVGNKSFFVILPDDLTHSTCDIGNSCLQQMMNRYTQDKGNMVAFRTVPKDQVSSYGIVVLNDDDRITQMVEKPNIDDAPSPFAIIGRYILHPDIFTHLRTIPKGTGGEFQLTDAMVSLLDNQPFYGYHYDGMVLDCSTQLGFLEANMVKMLSNTKTSHATQNLINQYSTKSE